MASRPTRRTPNLQTRARTLLPRNSVQRVAVVFVLLLVVMLPLSMFSADWSGWNTITGTTAAMAARSARAVGIDAQVSGSFILLPSRTLAIDPECSAVTLMVVYIALVLAYPLAWHMRLLALLIGIPLLAVANLARIVGVAYASEMLSDRPFYMVHDYLFEVGMLLLVVAMWAVWLSVARTSR